MNDNAKLSNKAIIIIIVVVVLAIIGIVIARNSSVRLGPVIGQGNITNITKTTTQCSDGIDNDGDRRCDFNTTFTRCRDGSTPGDSGCSSKSDNTETSCVAGSTTCGVGACQRTSTCVNDQVQCTPGTPTEEVCDDDIDNDCDGETDEGCVQQIANSCEDTDGGQNYLVRGIVSGTFEGVQYSNTDICLSTSNLREYYCDGDINTSINVNCRDIALNQTTNTTRCSEGACIF